MGAKDDFDRMVDIYIEIFGNKWNLKIINEILIGSKRFNELKRTLDPITQTVLTRHLKQLKGFGIISRDVIPGPPVEVRYSLTPQGIELYTPMLNTFSWIINNVMEEGKEE